jgi:hypothetical protein
MNPEQTGVSSVVNRTHVACLGGGSSLESRPGGQPTRLRFIRLILPPDKCWDSTLNYVRIASFLVVSV